MVRALDQFRSRIERARQDTSEAGATVTANEVNRSLYPVVRDGSLTDPAVQQTIKDEFNRSTLTKGARTLVNQVLTSSSPTVNQALIMWGVDSQHPDLDGGSHVSLNEACDALRLIARLATSPEETTAAREFLRIRCKPAVYLAATTAFDNPSTVQEPPPPVVSPKPRVEDVSQPLAQYRSHLERFTNPNSEEGKALNRCEANALLYLLVRDVLPRHRQAALDEGQRLISNHKLLNNAAKSVRQFVNTGDLTPSLRFECWLAFARGGKSDGAGIVLGVPNIQEGLAILRDPSLTESGRDEAFRQLAACKMTSEARALFNAQRQGPPDPALPVAPVPEPIPPPPVAPPGDDPRLQRFRTLAQAFQTKGSEYDENINLNEALALLFVLSRDVVPVDPTTALREVDALLGQPNIGVNARKELNKFRTNPQPPSGRLFDMWLAHATRRDSPSGMEVDEAEMQDGLGILDQADVTAETRKNALDAAAKAPLTSAARDLLQARLAAEPKPPAPVTEPPPPNPPAADPSAPISQQTTEAVGRFWGAVSAYRQPSSGFQENINLHEARAALYLLASGVPPDELHVAVDAVEQLLAQGRIGPDATKALNQFLSTPRVHPERVYHYWFDWVAEEFSNKGTPIGESDVLDGLKVLDQPEVSETFRVAALSGLKSTPLTDAARARFDAYCSAHGIGSATLEGSASSFAVADVYQRFCAFNASAMDDTEDLVTAFYRHAFTRHAGQTDAEIMARLEREPDIGGSGAFTSRDVAAAVIDAAVSRNLARITSWMQRVRTLDMIPLRYTGTEVIGRGMLRGEAGPTDKHNARVIIQKMTPDLYRIVTAFPED